MSQPETRIGPYTLVHKIGEGQFGVVWLAERRTMITTTRFALKLPKAADVEMEEIKREAEVWMQASGHPNVLPIIEAEIYDEQVVIVSEYAPDGSLADWLKLHKGHAPSIESAVEMTTGILAGLEHLHERKIVHRDIKPDNILLQRETPRLADFGIARLLKTVSSMRLAGTPIYMAPEAFDGVRTVQTDIWSVGAILYQLLAGEPPFTRSDMPSLIKAIINDEPPALPASVPDYLRQIMARALEKSPGRRFQSAAEFRQALRDAGRIPLSVVLGADLDTVNTLKANRVLQPKPLPARLPTYFAEPNLGPLVSKMCDRRQQENEFSDFFLAHLKQRAGTPQVFLIRGEEKECHDSLIERLAATRIKQIAERKWGTQAAVIILKTPDWAYDGALAERQIELKRSLFYEFDPAYMEEELSPSALSRLPTLALSSLVVIRHRIHAARWDQMTASLLNWYTTYWAELHVTPATPQFLIFLSVIYPKAQTGRWWESLFGAKRFDKKLVERELQTLASAAKEQLPFLLLKELTPIRPDEVHDWFSRYNIFDEKRRLELSAKIFETQGGGRAEYLSMADIEHALYQIHQSFIKERGYM
jgi:serine/threonine protein kinase